MQDGGLCSVGTGSSRENLGGSPMHLLLAALPVMEQPLEYRLRNRGRPTT